MAKAHKYYRDSFFKGKIIKFCMDFEERIDVCVRADKLGMKISKSES